MDGALLDLYHLPHGYWEAKDEKDDLAKEVQLKLDKGYPSDNTIFQAPERAILYQGGTRVYDENISRPEALVSVVNQFFDYKAPHIEEWQHAVDEFSERVPELSSAVEKLIKEERLKSPAFARAFADFYALCQQAINPNLSEDAVERMLVQHLLTERIFRKIFNNPDFSKRNVVAAEIEKVITELTRRAFNRDEFLKRLEPFYHAIEVNADNATEYSEKQHFLNTVYERFFQGYSPKEADTHGIVYTPQPIVNFMVRSVEEILKKEFDRSLSDKGVHILDPFVGTGNFITRIMQEIKTTELPYKYENELHCNEVMLLPYYIASMNIEHAYFERTDEYRAFPGICLVDTFELAEGAQSGFSFMTAENAERVMKQKGAPIFVIIGNPPYNAWQLDENDNNRNRRYPAMDKRVADSYARDSAAQNKNALRDPYIKAIRWASDRIGAEGVVALVTNSGFVDSIGADGMRRQLANQFDVIYILDLGGNVRRNPKLSGTTHNVFGIRPGVSVNLLVRRSSNAGSGVIRYARVDEYWRKEQKYTFLDEKESVGSVSWQRLAPDEKGNWLTAGLLDEFDTFPGLSSFFTLESNGLKTNRDDWAYNFGGDVLAGNVVRTIEAYSQEVARWANRTDRKITLDDFLLRDEKRVSWSETLKKHVEAGDYAKFERAKIRRALYRPFCSQYVYFDGLINERQYQLAPMFPVGAGNVALWCKVGSDWPFFALAASSIPDVLPQGGSKCFPFYTYAEDGTHRRENVTDWALEQFRSYYHDASITKWDIFHYIYAVLHHPEYRERYAANLRRELPRIPFATLTTCHPEAAESDAKRATPNEEPALSLSKGPMHSGGGTGAAGKSIDPSARKKRSPQDDKVGRAVAVAGDAVVFRAFAQAGQRLAEIGYLSWVAILSPLRGLLGRFRCYPRLTPWAAFLRRSAAGTRRRGYAPQELHLQFKIKGDGQECPSHMGRVRTSGAEAPVVRWLCGTSELVP
ncbi:MAG: type ISP restriction/modification enzyme [Terriglobales bacterium]